MSHLYMFTVQWVSDINHIPIHCYRGKKNMFEIFLKMKPIPLYSDPCLRAPNGFTYGMEESRCRSYWICVDSHSLGSCCAPGTHYVEGMGCMRGLACNDACPPNGGKIYTREY